jgi:hypothetical protein
MAGWKEWHKEECKEAMQRKRGQNKQQGAAVAADA